MKTTTHYCCPRHENEILFTEISDSDFIEFIQMKHNLPEECPICKNENQKTYSYFKSECIEKIL